MKKPEVSNSENEDDEEKDEDAPVSYQEQASDNDASESPLEGGWVEVPNEANQVAEAYDFDGY